MEKELFIGIFMLLVGKIISDFSSNRKLKEMEDRFSEDKKMWAGMFKILEEKLDALHDSMHQNNLLATGKVATEKFDAVISKVYESINEVKEMVNECLRCANYKKNGG